MSDTAQNGLAMGRRERGLVTDLFLRNPPSFPVEEDAAAGRRWLKTVLIDCDALAEHIELLSTLYRSRYRRALSRRDRPEGAAPQTPPPAGFRYFRLPEEAEAEKVLDGGVGKEVVSDAQVAEWLLNPFALDDLASRIAEGLPEAWFDDMAATGRAMQERYGLPSAEELLREMRGEDWDKPRDVAEVLVGMERMGKGGTATVRREGPDAWALTFGEAVRGLERRLAEEAYGDAERPFTLTLHALAAEEAGVPFQLAAAPAPCRNPLRIAATFPGGERRVFTIEVPPEVREAPPEEWRPSMSSLPCEPVPVQALELKGGEWDAASGPPGTAELVLRS